MGTEDVTLGGLIHHSSRLRPPTGSNYHIILISNTRLCYCVHCLWEVCLNGSPAINTSSVTLIKSSLLNICQSVSTASISCSACCLSQFDIQCHSAKMCTPYSTLAGLCYMKTNIYSTNTVILLRYFNILILSHMVFPLLCPPTVKGRESMLFAWEWERLRVAASSVEEKQGEGWERD